MKNLKAYYINHVAESEINRLLVEDAFKDIYLAVTAMEEAITPTIKEDNDDEKRFNL